MGDSGGTPRRRLVQMAKGLGLAPHLVIDQHFRRRDRLGRLLTALSYNPEPLGVGIDEDTAAILEADGTMRLFGRDSLVVNTGGEKVFVEEVEEVLRAHPAVADALVVGRPSERWGDELVALVALRKDVTAADSESLHEHCTAQLARFKAPKEFIFVEQVRRLGNGKADYRWAKSVATQKATV